MMCSISCSQDFPRWKMKRKAENIEEALLDVVLLKKPEGWTPLQAIKKFKEEHPLYRTAKMSYAGRLDPMAHGTSFGLIKQRLVNITRRRDSEETERIRINEKGV